MTNPYQHISAARNRYKSLSYDPAQTLAYVRQLIAILAAANLDWSVLDPSGKASSDAMKRQVHDRAEGNLICLYRNRRIPPVRYSADLTALYEIMNMPADRKAAPIPVATVRTAAPPPPPKAHPARVSAPVAQAPMAAPSRAAHRPGRPRRVREAAIRNLVRRITARQPAPGGN